MVKIAKIVSDYSSNCYIVKIINKNYLIDPSIEVNIIKKYLKDESIDGILLTHGHIDHIYTLSEVANEYNCNIYMSKYGMDIAFNEIYNYSINMGINKQIRINKERIMFINDNDIINDYIKVLYTPGHTIDSVCFIIEDKIFTGDTLFNGNVGRTDLYSGNTNELINSIKKIYNLKKNYFIYPGHDEDSNLNYQIINNSFVRKILIKNKQ